MSVAQLLVIEPQNKERQFLKSLFIKEGYQVALTDKGSEASIIIDESQPDIIILSDKLKDISPKSLCWEIRREYPDIPIIVVLNEPNKSLVKRFFRAGANDFVTRPIRTENLLARIRGRLTQKRSAKTKYKIADLELDVKQIKVKRAGKQIDLTPREFKLLKFLMRHQGRVLTREVILDRVWSYDSDVQSRVVDVYIGYLRDKIDSNFNHKLIRTVRGFGYTIKE